MGIFSRYKKSNPDPFDNSNLKMAANKRGSLVEPYQMGNEVIDKCLREQRERYAHLEAALRRGHCEPIFCNDGVGFIILDKPTDTIIFECFSDDANTIKSMANLCKADQLDKVITTCEPVRDYLAEHYKYNHTQVCIQGICLNSQDFKQQLIITPATMDDVPFIRGTYEPVPDGTIKDRVKTGNMWVGRLEQREKPIAYAGIHSDDSVGFEYVMPEHRRHHYGIEITDFVTDIACKRGILPYIQILSSNNASIRMNHYIGYQFYEGFIYWLFQDFE